MAKTRSQAGKAGVEPETIEMAAAGNDVERLRKARAEIDDLLSRLEPSANVADKVSRHLRRHLPLYAMAAVFALIVILIPTTNRNDPDSASDITSGDTSGDDFASDFDTGSDTGDDAANGDDKVTDVAGPIAGPTTSKDGKKVGTILVGAGKTVGGFECKPGVRQIPWSVYANPCVGEFVGNNGGNTFRGVTDKTIKIGIRKFAVDAGDVTDTQSAAQGAATRAEGVALFKKYTKYFEKVFELYGRKIEFVDFQSRVSNGVEEAQSRGEEGACADATDLAETHKVFAVVGYGSGLTETQPFADCAAERKIFVPFGASYFPEKWYKERWHPYVWHQLMECERIARDVGEYVGKRLWNRNAKWALDPVYKNKKRVFGTYVPDNDGYQRCVDISETVLEKEYGGKIEHRYDYLLDVARFPDQARQATIQFQAAGVTTLINACDTLSSRFLTESADDINWGPEWFIIGVATQDSDGAARTFDQAVVDGHLFGMSQLGATAGIEGKVGESYKSWKTAFPNEATPRGFGAVYYRVLNLFVMLQAAGPILTPENIGKGLQAMPDGGGEKGAYGTWSFKGDHTAVDDSREIYWTTKKKGWDGNNGTYLETGGGKRYRAGEWPKTEPAIYP